VWDGVVKAGTEKKEKEKRTRAKLGEASGSFGMV
jgi:hypothetical protein